MPLRQRELQRELLLRQLGVPLGLPLLAGKAAQLRLYFGDQVLYPLQVLVRFLETALGAVLAVAIEADARRLLEQRPPLVGTIGEEQLDHLRFDDHAGIAAEAGAAQQILDVAEPDGRLVEEVFAGARPGEPPGDHHLAIGDRQGPVGVVEVEGDLGNVDRAAGGRPLEDHVLHLAAAEQARRLLAEHPSHGVGYVRLAAAIGTHDGGDAGLEGQLDGVGERLEAGELELRELHRWILCREGKVRAPACRAR